jgi:hypothetical protein
MEHHRREQAAHNAEALGQAVVPIAHADRCTRPFKAACAEPEDQCDGGHVDVWVVEYTVELGLLVGEEDVRDDEALAAMASVG